MYVYMYVYIYVYICGFVETSMSHCLHSIVQRGTVMQRRRDRDRRMVAQGHGCSGEKVAALAAIGSGRFGDHLGFLGKTS